MTRGVRYTVEEFEALQARKKPAAKPKRKAKAKAKAKARPNDLADHVLENWTLHPDAAGIPLPIREHRFHAKRRWRLDLAWPSHRIGVEIHGGTWSRGRHVRGAGIKADCEKARALVFEGWRLLTYTDDDVRELGVGRIIADVRALMEGTDDD